MVVSVIIPNWNGKYLLKKCLPSLRDQTFKDFEVILVDNGSSDGSVEYVEKKFPKFKCIKLSKNFGFAGPVNVGIKNSRGKYIVLVNNDTRLDKNCLKYLVQAANSHPEVGMVAAKILKYYNHKIIDSAGDWIDEVGHASNIGLGEKDGPKYNKPKYIFLITGGGGLFKREVFEKVGGFDEDYFAYMEDVDLCLRAQMAGYKAWYEPRSVIYHIHKATSLKDPKLLEYFQFRNMTQTIIKDFPKALLLRNLNWLKIILVNLNTVVYLFKKGFGVSALKAEWYILTHLDSLIRKRGKVQKMKVISDDYIIQNFRKKNLKL